MGVAAGDYDRDGFPDLYVTQYGRSILYHNNGDGTFTDVTEVVSGRRAGLRAGSGLITRTTAGWTYSSAASSRSTSLETCFAATRRKGSGSIVCRESIPRPEAGSFTTTATEHLLT